MLIRFVFALEARDFINMLFCSSPLGENMRVPTRWITRSPSACETTERGQLYNKINVKCAMTIQTRQSSSSQWTAAQETISAHLEWVVNDPHWVLNPTSPGKQHAGQSPARSQTLWQVHARRFVAVKDFWACNSNNYMLLLPRSTHTNT